MNLALLLQHFDRVSEASDVIPRLWQFILDLAIRGKLTELTRAPFLRKIT